MDQLSESKAVIGLNMLRLWDDRHPRALDRAAGRGTGDGTFPPRPCGGAFAMRRGAPDSGGTENIGKVVLVLEVARMR